MKSENNSKNHIIYTKVDASLKNIQLLACDVMFQVTKYPLGTGKSLSEALIFASTNLQYDDRLFIELQFQYMKIPSSEHGKNMLCTQIGFFFCFFDIYVHDMFSPCSELGIFMY